MYIKNNGVNFLIVDDHPLVCAAISHMLNEKEYTHSISEANNALDAMKLVKENNIDFIVLDVDLVDSDGFEFLRRAKAYGYAGKVLFVSVHNTTLYAETAYKLGANGYVTKTEGMNDIREAVEAILKGYSVFKSNEFSTISDKETKLSKREAVVFNYLIRGLSNKEIAQNLSLSSKTVSTYKVRIFDKYKVKSLVELIKIKDMVV